MKKSGADRKESAPFYLPDFKIEQSLISSGAEFIAGVDEAGRGALAGPLSVGMVIYNADMVKNPPPEIFKLIRDSKKLTPSARSSALAFINANALFIASVMIPHKIIDQININRATGLALDRLLKLVPFIPDIVIMDGNMKFNPAVRYMPVKRGDSLSVSIASASIAAKVERDRIMERMDGVFPGYGFTSHKGYGTTEHICAIHRLGPCKIHRMSYEPLKSSFGAGQDITHEGN